ncbi:prokaryotic cytochrome C oxidase subunit IV family protein [Actinomadura craniellae]|uniref:Prokaryotic cytochrome C oxidase subunit IV family protein n=1 Tax=Actinomadura craniellae TaxID=2231787 RepID=A0A365H0I5_9ACTN|nr:cytochrome C oxidase subunit IV family protein [Actinomadura craniellae]RAY12528.1 prokaryotic cytochrome C oxidase subunit IV family protein [Actinomadura craniellae]
MTTPATTDKALLEKDRRAFLLVWIALSAATVLAWLLAPGEPESSADLGWGPAAAIVLLGLVKCRLIIRYFMEVRHAPRWLQTATDAWLAVLWITLLGIYLFWPGSQ